CQHNYGSPYSF
nr:immunoglobulin light chain junction region [Macaca mulatta]